MGLSRRKPGLEILRTASHRSWETPWSTFLSLCQCMPLRFVPKLHIDNPCQGGQRVNAYLTVRLSLEKQMCLSEAPWPIVCEGIPCTSYLIVTGEIVLRRGESQGHRNTTHKRESKVTQGFMKIVDNRLPSFLLLLMLAVEEYSKCTVPMQTYSSDHSPC